jgi:Flp pilus assembly protein TadB
MSLQLSCPACGRVETVPDEVAGQSLTCPTCATQFLAQDVNSKPPRRVTPPRQKDRPRRRRDRDDEDPFLRSPLKERRGSSWIVFTGIGVVVFVLIWVVVLVAVLLKG